ncbi:MAG: RDD family protein [Acidobacteriota bacterium]
MIQEVSPSSSIESSINDDLAASTGGDHVLDSPLEEDLAEVRPQPSTLIEFPHARPVPEWRKQLSQRVREVQERKAREAAEEAAAAQEAGAVSAVLPSAQLELVPDLEQPLMNPIVSKVLERLERARRVDHLSGGFTATATAPAFEPKPEVIYGPEPTAAPVPETKHKLTVVAPARPEPEPEPTRKPVRVISDNVDDISLSYLESYLSIPAIESDRSNYAGLGRRTSAGFLDLLLVVLMISPVAAVIEFTDGRWTDPRVIGLLSGIAVATIIAYHTISIALTGRTVGMRMLSLRTIDIRTGMIPTGGQAFKRAFGYLFSLIPAGLGLMFAAIDPDGRAIHDRFSKTVVIRS